MVRLKKDAHHSIVERNLYHQERETITNIKNQSISQKRRNKSYMAAKVTAYRMESRMARPELPAS
jgi:hypothetical protein